MLKDRGWSAGDVYGALGRYYAEATGIELPAPRGRLESAREAFFHLLAFSTLGTWIFATGYLWFELINRWFPDATQGRSYVVWTWSEISWQMASLIVAFPAFLWATRRILADQEANPGHPVSPLRRWITNLALLLTAITFICDLVTFVATFLQGGITTRFTMKSAVVLILAGAVFLYYNRGLARDASAPRRWHLSFAAGALAAILLSLALGFLQTGSPATQRLIAQDNRRIQDLSAIANMVRARSRNGSFPETLTGIEGKADPFTQRPYEYRPLTYPNYELCATFDAASVPGPAGTDNFWKHPAGRHCFNFETNNSAPFPQFQ